MASIRLVYSGLTLDGGFARQYNRWHFEGRAHNEIFIATSQVDEWLYNVDPQNYAAGWVDAFAQYSSDFQQAAVGTPGIGGEGYLDQ